MILEQPTLDISHRQSSDKYFLRSNQILKALGHNPYVTASVFIRKGPGVIGGIEEAIDYIKTHSDIERTGSLKALPDGSEYTSGEVVMKLTAPVQSIIELETQYLGIISAGTTRASGDHEPDPAAIEERMREIVEAAKGRPVSYFGARHWHPAEDPRIAAAAFRGGAASCSTDAGAATNRQEGVGTIPHALENIYAYLTGPQNAVVDSTLAFDRVIDENIPRIALIDYRNREVDDAVAVARAMHGRLAAVRIDTCGENTPQGGLQAYDQRAIDQLAGRPIEIPAEDRRYWAGRGVTITGTLAVREALDAAGHQDVDIILTSGFGEPAKVRAFTRAEELLGRKLYDGLGVGGVYESRAATMDIVAAGDPSWMSHVGKTGRVHKRTDRLEAVITRLYR